MSLQRFNLITIVEITYVGDKNFFKKKSDLSNGLAIRKTYYRAHASFDAAHTEPHGGWFLRNPPFPVGLKTGKS